MKRKGILACACVLLAGLLLYCGQTVFAAFNDNDNDTVSDSVTGLMWQQSDDGTTRTWEEALDYCEDLSLGDHSDWRLPNVRELESIVDWDRYYPSIDTTYFPDRRSSNYWSSSTGAGNSDGAWYVAFSNGSVDSGYKGNRSYVRCVRAGLGGSFGHLTATITPQGAIDAGAQWRVDSGTWRDTGAVQSELTPGEYTLEFKNISGWNRPANQHITINGGRTTQAEGTYTPVTPNQGALEGFVTGVNTQGEALGTLSGAMVEVSGQGARSTEANGSYSFAEVNSGTYTVTASKIGYYSATRTVSLAAGETKTEIFSLTQDEVTAQPVAVDFESPNGKHFIPGMPGTISFETTIDWKGTPGTVRFWVAGQWYTAIITDLGSGQARATVTLPVPAVISSSEELLLEVVNGEGLKTTQGMEVYFHELPGIIPHWYLDTINWSWTGGKISHSESMSVKAWEWSCNEVYKSSASMDWQKTLSFDPKSGAFEGSLGATGTFSHNLEYQGVESIGKGSLGMSGNLTINLVNHQNPPTIIPGWSISAGEKAGIGYPVVRLVQVVFPPAAPAIDSLLAVPAVKAVLNALKARFFLIGDLGVEGEYDDGFNFACYFASSNVKLSGTLGFELQTSLEKWGAKVGVYCRGSGTPEVNVCPDLDFLGVVSKAYVGLFAKAWLFKYKNEVGSEIRLFSGDGAQTIRSVQLGNQKEGGRWQPIGKGPLKWGSSNRLATDTPELSLSAQALAKAGGSTEERIVENVIELAGPAVFADDLASVILFVLHDTEKPWYAATDITEVIRGGADPWAMARITDNLAAEFSPEITAVDVHTLLAVWTRVEGDVSEAEGPEDIVPHLEIVASRYDRVSDAWSEPSQLTSNNQVDRAPLPIVLAGMQGVLWIQNQGEAEIGNATNGDSLMYRAWTGSIWAATIALWSGQKGILDFTFVADGSGQGHVVLAVDEDGDPETVEDRELYRVSSLSGVWQAAVRLTDDDVEDSLPVLVAPEEQPTLVWKTGETLKYTSLASWAPIEVYSEYTTANEAPTLDGVTLPGGAAIAYTVQGAEGINIVAAFYDAALDRWSLPRQLTSDEDAEGSLSMAFDGERLVISYLKTQTLREDMEIELDGQVHVVENVPQPGRTDLYVLRHTLGHDLAVKLDFLIFEPGNPAPGTQANIRTTIENRGDLPAQNVLVSFYEGDPNDGGALIGQTTIVGPLVAGGSQEVTVTWDVSVDPNARRVFVVVDPELSFDDRDRSNNVESAWTLLPDLVMESNRHEWLSESSVALTATIGNGGVIPTGAITVCWRLNSEDGEELGCTQVESIGVGVTRETTLIWDASPHESPGSTVVVYALADPEHILIETSGLNNVGAQGIGWLPSLPTITTTEPTGITTTSPTSGGDITSDGGSPVTARGVCWSESPHPTIADTKTTDGTGTGNFTSTITGLDPNTEYHVRAYATNSAGTAYGNDVSFTILDDSDNDGLPDILEDAWCTDTYDADTDDDGIPDGVEDANQNGLVDTGETDPCNIDTDGDGIQDGTELGYTLGDIGPDTDTSIFQPDLDPSSTTDPLDQDTDNDGFLDGVEDTNRNGMVDGGEDDPMQSCQNDHVRIWGATSQYFVNLQSAYEDAANGDIIQCHATDLEEGLICDRDISLLIEGGYNCDYTTKRANTRINSLTISNGNVTIEGLVIK